MAPAILRCFAAAVISVLTLSKFSTETAFLRSNLDAPEGYPRYVMIDLLNLEDGQGYQKMVLPFGSGVSVLVLPLENSIISGIIVDEIKVYMPDIHNGDIIQSILTMADDEQMLVSIHLNEETIRLAMVGESFVRLTPQEYSYKISRLSFPHTLDLNLTESTSEVEVVASVQIGCNVLSYTPVYGYRIERVTDGTMVLWEDVNDNTHINEVRVFNYEVFSLVVLIIEDSNGTIIRYYLSKDGKYTRIARDEFFDCLNREDFAVEDVLARRQDTA